MKAKPFRLERSFDASPERLWRAWTDPKEYATWFNPAPGLDLVIRRFEMRVGGAIEFDMPQPNGDLNPQSGVVHVFDPPRRLVTGEPDRSFLVDVTFVPEGNRTRLVILVTGLPAEHHAPATQGWNALLDKLQRRLAGRGPEDPRELVVSREVGAPAARVWRAFTDPTEVGRWWGPDGFRTTTRTHEAREGGTWRFTMHGPDGTDYPNWIRFDEWDPPRRLSYEHGGAEGEATFRTTVELEERSGGRTRVTLRSRFASAEERDRVVREHNALEGGQQTLGRLAAHVEGR